MCCSYEFNGTSWDLIADGCPNDCPPAPNNPPASASSGDMWIEPCNGFATLRFRIGPVQLTVKKNGLSVTKAQGRKGKKSRRPKKKPK